MRGTRAFRLTGSNDWRGTTTLVLYRTVIAAGLLALSGPGLAERTLEASMAPDIYRLFGVFYLAACLVQLGLAFRRRAGHRRHLFSQIVVDIVALSLLSYVTRGASGGLPMLLIPSLAAGGIMLAARTAFLLAGFAVAGVLGQELLRAVFVNDAGSDFVQVGLLAVLYGSAVGLAVHLTQRLAASNATAADLASRSRDLARVNRHIIDRMQIGALVIDGADRIQTLNQAARELLELASTRTCTGCALDNLAPDLAVAIRQWRRTGQAPSLLTIGEQRLLPRIQRLDEDNDDTTAATLIFIEDSRRASEQAQQIKLVSLGRLSASIAHEIRNPLSAITHAAQLLAESESRAPDDDKLVAIIERHCRRIDRLVESVLGLARRNERRPSRLALAEWLTGAIADYRDVREDAPTFDIADHAGNAVIDFDENQLRRVLINLWDNSDRHARVERAPHIALWISRHGGRIALEVWDDGPGIPSDLRDQVMEPFFTTARDGTGLGLHLAAEMCEANGARLIGLPSARGAGFRILFPSSAYDTVEATHSSRPLKSAIP